jgi:hypothetical protein
MSITNSIKWNIEQTSYELTRDDDCRGVLIYKRADHLPQFFTAKEAAALCVQIRRMLDRSDFGPLASKLTGG